jgi:hypothetical protein
MRACHGRPAQYRPLPTEMVVSLVQARSGATCLVAPVESARLMLSDLHQVCASDQTSERRT